MTARGDAGINQSKTMLAMYFAAALAILLTRQTGTDYLYYYLPIADYFLANGLPRNVSPSVIDAPFAYPRAEYLLLALTSLFGDYRIYAIKLLHCLKVGALFWLALRISTLGGTRFFLPAAFIAPSLLIFLSIYNTDVNAAIGALALLAIYLGERRTLLPWLLVAFAASTKYTFWALLFPFYAVLWKEGRLGRGGLIPAVLVAVHLATNFHYYGNPVYPIGARVGTDFPDDLRRFIVGWSQYDLARHWIPNACAGFVAAGGLFFFAARIPLALLAALGVYIVAWLLGMQVSSSGDTGRFLLPATLVAACFLPAGRLPLAGRNVYAALAAAAVLCAVFAVREGWLYRFAFCAYVACAVLIYKGGAFRTAGYALAAVACFAYAGAKIYAKPDFGKDLGYAAYAEEIRDIDRKSDSALVFTDYRLLPHAMREKSGVVLWWSEVYSTVPRQIATTGVYDCRGRGLHVIGSREFLDVTRRYKLENCLFVTYQVMELR
jgi:hypothetical protein